jgi:hypothetical protein
LLHWQRSASSPAKPESNRPARWRVIQARRETRDSHRRTSKSVVSLTAAINSVDFVPGRAGELAFVGSAEGVATTTVSLESKAMALSLIQTSSRGAPPEQETTDKRTIRSVNIPHIPLEDTVLAAEVQNVRAMGSNDTLEGVIQVINNRLGKMASRHDLTLEHHRLGALKGEILDADASSLVNLFTLFGETQEAEVDFALGTAATDVRGKCSQVIRTMKRNLKLPRPAGARVWALCSDSFFDALISHDNVKGVYDGWAAAERRLGESYVHGVFEFGGIFFENYEGTDDNSTVTIATDKVQFFYTNVPGLYAEYYAPADFMETVNTIGLPRYAKAAPDTEFNRWVKLHTQQNPLPLCLRPKTLMIGKRA